MITIHPSFLNNELTIITVVGMVPFEKGLSASKQFYEGKVSRCLLWDMRKADAQLVSAKNVEAIMNYTRLNAYKRPIGAKTGLLVLGELEFGISRMVQIYAELHDLKIEFEIFEELPVLHPKYFFIPKYFKSYDGGFYYRSINNFISSLIESMPQINKVYSFPRELLKQPLKVLRLKKELKENSYDLLIAPSLMSSSDSFFSFLVSAKYKVGFYAPEVFSPLTHAVPFPKNIEHEALKPLALMSLFKDMSKKHFKSNLDIRLSHEEKESVCKEIPLRSIGIFRDARNEKKIDDEWWSELIKELHKVDTSLKFIDILDPNNTIALKKEMLTISEKNLRTLASKISNLDAFICGDTGPMHLASASGTATIALFKTTSPTLYGTLGKKDLSLIIQGQSVEKIAYEIIEHLKSI